MLLTYAWSRGRPWNAAFDLFVDREVIGEADKNGPGKRQARESNENFVAVFVERRPRRRRTRFQGHYFNPLAYHCGCLSFRERASAMTLLSSYFTRSVEDRVGRELHAWIACCSRMNDHAVYQSTAIVQTSLWIIIFRCSQPTLRRALVPMDFLYRCFSLVLSASKRYQFSICFIYTDHPGQP